MSSKKSSSDNPPDDASGASPRLSVVPVAELTSEQIRNVIEAALFAADEALTVDRLFKLFVPGELAEEGGRAQVRDALKELGEACDGRGFELKKVASGYRMQVRQALSPWVSRLWEEKPPRYTRALLETMALIAYKQPATRGDIEEVRGVTVSSNIMRTLLERGWIREVGQRDVPGRPSMYGTTKEFLDYFNLASLDELPSLPELRELVEPAAVAELEASEAASESADASALAPDAAPEQGADAAADSNTDTASETAAATGEPVQNTEGGADDAASEEGPARSDEQSSAAPVFAEHEVVVVTEEADAHLAVAAPQGVESAEATSITARVGAEGQD